LKNTKSKSDFPFQQSTVLGYTALRKENQLPRYTWEKKNTRRKSNGL